MIDRLWTDIGIRSVNHIGEQLCGDHVEFISPSEDTKILVLADGLGSGVKANILSTLTAKMLSVMMAKNMSIKECVHSVIETLPVCKERGVAYATFTIIKIKNNMFVELYNYDNPAPFVVRDGRAIEFDWNTRSVENKKVSHAKFICQPDDAFFLMSDGVKHAGIGETLNFGWDMDQIEEYAAAFSQPNFSAKAMATILLDHVDQLYNHRPGDDATVAVLRVRKRQQVNLQLGPASNIEDDNKMLSLFFGKEGIHIVSGGTTSSIAAKYLGKPLELALDYTRKDVPPIAFIEGVDLVTEGVITLNKVLEYAQSYLKDNAAYFEWCYEEDGASRIARYLFEEASDVNFFIGCAVNAAHQGEDVPINFKLKMQIVEELARCLREMGKNVKVNYF